MRIAAFHQCDVFTDRLFGGNPLAVVPNADGIASATMQAFAREMNCSESTFVLPARDPRAAFRVRIFTPGRELPFAGHPTIGTAWTLHRLGLLDAVDFAFEMEIGLVPVRREGSRFWMRPPLPILGAPLGDRSFAAALGVAESEIVGSARRSGPFFCVRVASIDAVAAIELDRRALRSQCERSIADGNILVVHYEAGRATVRMFAAIADDVGEDPATGSAVAPMLSFLAAAGALGEDRRAVEIEQGRWIGRTSALHARLSWTGSAISQVEVGGDCVHAFSGEIALEGAEPSGAR